MDKKYIWNSWLVKLYLLSYWVKITNENLKKINFNNFQENKYYYNVSNEPKLIEKYKIPSEILLPDDVESSLYLNHESPLEIKYIWDTPKLFYNWDYLSLVSFNKTPNFFNIRLSNWKIINQYASMYWRYTLLLFLNWYCDYIRKWMICKFCSLWYWRKTFWKSNEMIINNNELDEVIKIIKDKDWHRIKYLMYTSWTYFDKNFWILEQAKLIQTCNKYFDNQLFSHHLTSMPPDDLELIKKLKSSWLNSIAFDLEVFDENLFSYLCPWKDKEYWYNNFINSALNTLKIFWKNNVKIWFVWWLEDLDSMGKWMSFFAEKWFSIAVNVFHPDIWSKFKNFNRPSVWYLKDMIVIQRDLYKKHGLIPVFPEWWRRSSLDTEIYRWFFDEL